MASSNEHKLGLWGLMALVVGVMLGGGVFAIPQNLAIGAGTGAIVIGWIITGIGVISLAYSFRFLSHVREDLKNGVYSYAREVGGRYAGFNSAWGYWLAAVIGNVSYAVLLLAALSYFFPVFGNGNTTIAVIVGSIFLWAFVFLIQRGIKEAAFINLIATVCKLVPLFIFIVCAVFAFNFGKFKLNFWGSPSLGGIFEQVKSTMLVTLWVFIGVEGAVVESANAKKASDVGKATIMGLLLVLLIYIAISLLSLSIMTQEELAVTKNPSLGYVLERILGMPGALIIDIGLIISLLGAWLGWTLLAAQVPYDVAVDGSLPRIFGKKNDKNVPVGALYFSTLLAQVMLIVSHFYEDAYLSLVKLATTCVLIPYLFSSYFALYIVVFSKDKKKFKYVDLIASCIATLYAIWLIYAAGLKYLLLSSILYALGLVFFYWGAKERRERVFSNLKEKIVAILLVVCAGFAIWYEYIMHIF